MIVFYRPDGSIAFTASDMPPMLNSAGLAVLETDADLGDLAAWSVIDGALVMTSLEPAKAAARAAVVAVISAQREALITTMPGQDMIYLRKEAEARAYVADPAPDLADYPMIAAEIGITAESAEQVAQVWLNMAALWVQAAAGLEAMRLGAMAQIEAAADLDTIAQVMAALEP